MVHFSRFQSVFCTRPEVNHVVNDLRAVPGALREEGVSVDPKVAEYNYEKFGSITDPHRKSIEFWEPLPKKESQ